jgi:pimeloyl-ACP methyl ester carboxylesterase
MCEHIPQAEQLVITESGHFTTLEQPTQVNTALRRWLSQTP